MHGLRQAGERPVLGPVMLGVAGLIGGVLAGWLGGRAALAMFGPFESEDPWNLFGNTIALFLPLMLLGAGIIVGFVAGTVILPSLVMFGLRWARAGNSFRFLLLLLIPVVPITIWVIVEMSSELNSRGPVMALIWSGALVVGGLTPAAARSLATRRQRLPATGERESE